MSSAHPCPSRQGVNEDEASSTAEFTAECFLHIVAVDETEAMAAVAQAEAVIREALGEQVGIAVTFGLEDPHHGVEPL